jgi:transposase
MLWVIRPLFLTKGQESDLVGTDELLPQVEADVMLGDKYYDADERVREVLRLRGIRCVIPFKKTRLNPGEYDKELYKERHVIENFFCKLKQ